MTDEEHRGHHRGHETARQKAEGDTHDSAAGGKWYVSLHRKPAFWLAVALMLAGMVIYVMSMDEGLRPGGVPGAQVPAAP